MATNQFYPRLAYINALTNAIQAQATFTAAHDYTVGEIVAFRVTKDFGMYEINNKRGKVLSTTSTSITVDINSLDWTAFDYSKINTAKTTPPTCVPCCTGVTTGPISVTNYNDAFDNRRI